MAGRDASSDFSDEILPRPPTSFFAEEPAAARPRPVVKQGSSKKVAAGAAPAVTEESADVKAFKELLLRHFSQAQAAHSAALEIPEEVNQKEREQLIASVSSAAQAPNAELSEQEQEVLRQRHAAQQKQLQEYERKRLMRKVRMLRSMYPFLTEKEGEHALRACGGDEDDTASKLTDYQFLTAIRKKVAMETPRPVLPVFNPRQPIQSAAHDGRLVARNRGTTQQSKRKSGNGTEKVKRIRLDEALKQASESGSMEGWSEARKRAYALIKTNPNAYYYRFNDPGVAQKNGKWSKEEQELFMKRMKEVGVDGQWGIFSMTIPGRVGYQCSNFYRFLIQQGKVKDDNYMVDEKGKVHYLFAKGTLYWGAPSFELNWQLQVLEAQILCDTLHKRWPDAPLFLCGDLNANPSEPVLQLLRLGSLDRSVALNRPSSGSPIAQPYGPMVSAYSQAQPAFPPTHLSWPPPGSQNFRYICVDHILFRPAAAKLLAVKTLPAIDKTRPLPQDETPSDHLMIAASFQLNAQS